MKELSRIIDHYNKIKEEGEQAALATVVHVNGSSYRRPGATMLIKNDGHWIGSVSGGCLEGDVLRKARMVMESQQPTFVTYDTSSSENNTLGIKLGCEGIIDIFIEPLGSDQSKNPLELLQSFTVNRQPVAMATIYKTSGDLDNELGKRKMLAEGGDMLNQLLPVLDQLVTRDFKLLGEKRKSFIKQYQFPTGSADVMYKLIQPVTQLILFGGGNDVNPVAKIAKTLNWYVTVTGDCPARMAPANFPDADEVVYCPRDEILKKFTITPYTAGIIMSHSFDFDKSILKHLSASNIPYIGLLGPKRRSAEIVEELKNEGNDISNKISDQTLHSPVGLDIGGETPQEIALSIIAEIQAVFHKRKGVFLRERQEPIHDRAEHDALKPEVLS